MEDLLRNLFITQNPPLSLQEGIILFIIFTWSIAWKGLALWHAAHNREKIWFVVILIANTAGILEILYLFIFSTSKLDIRVMIDKIKASIHGKL
ncbi:hypothetical protein A3D06_01360 [Candidatus Roizmanbacteria bacterium RIFCSPHIGHO2_02_FULL_40_9]|uniref:DUF5652 domain-containing protein n=1 Tax=Candidatus Roizmanbacteria bacterium RIFCSPHIGHO2_02_FULL_40_9 TaxID=1802042 RepID=A0A1F7HBR9_9BACT|nr:MAG: hypothetical protein A3D06_01360 [Candidatus Roizmanbacteria bacterium RIFCSPHIGHO2_02_FULL_40_9]